MLWFPWIESAGTKSRSSVMIVNRNSSRCYCHGVVCQGKEPEDFGICWNQPAHLLMISRSEQLWGTFHAMTLDCISSSMLCFLWSRSAACWNNNKNNNNYNNNTCWTLQLTTCCHRYRASTLYTRVIQGVQFDPKGCISRTSLPCIATHGLTPFFYLGGSSHLHRRSCAPSVAWSDYYSVFCWNCFIAFVSYSL